MTAAEVWRLILQAALALSSGVLLATLARRFTKSDKSVEEQLAFKSAQMQSEAGFRDELRQALRDEMDGRRADRKEYEARIEELEELINHERERCEERHEKKDIYIERLEQALRVEGRPLPPEDKAQSA